MSAIKYWLWLSTSAKLPPRAKAALLEHYGTPENIFTAPKGEISRLLGDKVEGAETLERRDLSEAMRIIDRCAGQGIRIVTVQDALYPDRLKNIYSPPSVIYVKGELPNIDEEAAIAVIGTRRASPYGIRMAQKLGYGISKCGGLVVSGLTVGADEAGAEGALSAGGGCVGVLGVPHELCKGRIYDELSVRGTLISEYPPGTEPSRAYFRARNRITAGLSVGVAVVEAPEQSGTKLFVAEAADQGKEIFAVPGNADSPNCAGSNAMLKDGAKAVTDAWDIMCEFEARFPNRVKKSDAKMPTGFEKTAYELPKTARTHEIETKKAIDKPEKAVYIDLQKQLESLSEAQIAIITAMDTDGIHVDTIIERTGLTPSKVLAELTMLQLKGFVRQESGKRFTLIIKAK